VPAERTWAVRRAALRDDGVVVVPGLLDDGWCRRLRDAIGRCRTAPGPHYGVLSPPGRPRVDSDLFRWGDDADLHAVTHDSPLVDAAAALLDDDAVVLVEDQWFASEPGATTPSPWHQDEPYYRLDRPFLTIWVTLDDIGVGSSLRVVPGSHLGPTYGMVEFSATSSTIDDNDRTTDLPVPDVEADPDGYAVRAWTLRAGDAIAIDSRTLHATGPDALAGPFRRLSTRWASAATRYRRRDHGAAAFWDVLPHGLEDGDPLAGDVFPLVRPAARL
jgi:hypothetical protein